MQRAALIVLGVFITALFFPGLAMAADDPSTPGELVSREVAQDGSVVVIQGEAIGESLRADADHRWVNLLGGGVAVGVYMSDEMSEQIEHWGVYSTFGDTVMVRGVVNYSCVEHGGEFDVHADEMQVLESGGPRENPASPWKLGLGFVLIVVGALQYRLFRYLKNKGPA